MEDVIMVEKSYTAHGGNGTEWWPGVLDPLRSFGNKVADFFTPNADASAKGESYEINVELPGVAEKDIDVSLHDRVLGIRGEKRTEKKEEGKTFYFSERSYGAFQRTFRLPEDADENGVEAVFKDGVLNIKIAKTAAVVDKAKKIKIKS
jgi:HSP20 family protein